MYAHQEKCKVEGLGVILLIRRVPPNTPLGLPKKPEIKAAKEPRAKQVEMFVRWKSAMSLMDLSKDGVQTIDPQMIVRHAFRDQPEDTIPGGRTNRASGWRAYSTQYKMTPGNKRQTLGNRSEDTRHRRQDLIREAHEPSDANEQTQKIAKNTLFMPKGKEEQIEV